MKFGVMNGVMTEPMPPGRAFGLAAGVAQVARESGFDGIFAGQHYLAGPDVSIFDPLMLLAYVAAQCPGMYVGTSIYLLPLHHEVISVAEQVATLDVLSEGRLLFGVGQGYRDEEFDAFGVSRGATRRRLAEAIQALRALWSGEHVSFAGDFYRFNDATLSMPTVQRGGPPILVAADRLRTVAEAPVIGDHWVVSPRHTLSFLREAVPVYREALRTCGREYKGLYLIRELALGRTTEEAERTVREAFGAIYQRYDRWRQPGENYGGRFEQLRQDRLLVGSSEQVAEQILALHREFTVEFMWFRVYYPGLDPERAFETVRQFGSEVLPAVRNEM